MAVSGPFRRDQPQVEIFPSSDGCTSKFTLWLLQTRFHPLTQRLLKPRIWRHIPLQIHRVLAARRH